MSNFSQNYVCYVCPNNIHEKCIVNCWMLKYIDTIQERYALCNKKSKLEVNDMSDWHKYKTSPAELTILHQFH